MALQDEYIRTSLRLPPGLHGRIHEAATLAERSFNDELIARLRESFEQQPVIDRLDRIEAALMQLQKKGR
jgi:hypothetical protein